MISCCRNALLKCISLEDSLPIVSPLNFPNSPHVPLIVSAYYRAFLLYSKNLLRSESIYPTTSPMKHTFPFINICFTTATVSLLPKPHLFYSSTEFLTSHLNGSP